MNALVSIIIQLISGAVGGNLSGMIKKLNLGSIGNTIAGAVGGAGATQVLPMLSNTSMNGTLMEIISSIIGGAVVSGIVGFIRNMMK